MSQPRKISRGGLHQALTHHNALPVMTIDALSRIGLQNGMRRFRFTCRNSGLLASDIMRTIQHRRPTLPHADHLDGGVDQPVAVE